MLHPYETGKRLILSDNMRIKDGLKKLNRISIPQMKQCADHTHTVKIIDLISHTTYVVCVNFIHKLQDLQF